MKMLVTGGSGFIGSHLCKKLLQDGHQVLCVDNFCSSDPAVVEVNELYENSNYEFIEMDITSPEFPLFLSSTIQVEAIYHLACPASPKYYQKDPLHTIKTCIDGTINVLNYARSCGAKVLFTSTSEIYGEPLEHPQTEEYRGNVNTLGIRACYDEGKRLAETIMIEYNRLYGLDVKIVRIFNTYGEGMNRDDGRVLTNFIKQALAGETVTIYGDGKQTRCFCHVEDMVRGLIMMMGSTETGPINLGGTDEITIGYAASMVIGMTGSDSRKKKISLPSDDPTRRRPDTTKARDKLGWSPEISFPDGLRRMIEYLKKV